MTRLLIGLDVGTTHTKGVLIGSDGRTLATASRQATLHSR
jgi:sugar (pentulose or hexulose) kinase